MTKTDKKLDNNLRQSLTTICEQEKDNIAGFAWLTHSANYSALANSLRITCVFTSNAELTEAKQCGQTQGLVQIISCKLQSLLQAQGIKAKALDKCIRFDSEENCEREHGGNWAKRLN